MEHMLWVLLVPLVLLPARRAAPPPPLPWSYKKIIRAVEGANASNVGATPTEPSDLRYQLIDNLPFVDEAAEAETLDDSGHYLAPEPEDCDGCLLGTEPQMADAGHVNSLMSVFEERRSVALPGQFPWHATLLYKDAFFSCSGALVSSQWVLTAANCAKGFDYIMVRLGSYRPSARRERFRTTLRCTHIVVHPGYRKGVPRSDIAALRLPAAVATNSYVLPVRLPSRGDFLTTYAGRKAWLSGWGTNFPLGTFNSTAALGFLTETVISNEQCAKTFGPAVRSSVLCTTTNNFGRGCLGDSGAPLVVEERGVFVLVGVHSFSAAAGCSAGRPAGFTRIASFSRWIESVTGVIAGPSP